MAVPPADPAIPASLIVNHPLNIDALDRVGPTRAPEAGEHTDDVLRELGYSETEIAGLRERGAL
jgi:formyl-CoA transferase